MSSYYDSLLTSFHTWWPMLLWGYDPMVKNFYFINKNMPQSSNTITHKKLCWQWAWGLIISKKHFHPGGRALSEWTCSLRAIRDSLEADYSWPRVNTTCPVSYHPPITVSPFPLALSVSCFKQTLWRCGQL